MRKSSEAPFPYGYYGRVCYIEQVGEQLTQLRTRADQRNAVLRAQAGDSQILAVWPGEYNSDLFLIDELDKLANTIGLTHL